jgi:hypothetical protein
MQKLVGSSPINRFFDPVSDCNHGCVQSFAVLVEGSNWEDVQDVELPVAPREGDTIETKYGTCVVTRIEAVSEGSEHVATIVCRFP